PSPITSPTCFFTEDLVEDDLLAAVFRVVDVLLAFFAVVVLRAAPVPLARDEVAFLAMRRLLRLSQSGNVPALYVGCAKVGRTSAMQATHRCALKESATVRYVAQTPSTHASPLEASGGRGVDSACSRTRTRSDAGCAPCTA